MKNKIGINIKNLAKDFIRKCLITDPVERASIEQVMSHKWITHYNKNPSTVLATSQVLREEQANWQDVSVKIFSIHF